MDDIGGVWRTIGGRRIFIKDGQNLATAMKESGKFNNDNKKIKQQYKTKQEVNKKIKELNKKIYSREQFDEEEYNKLKKEVEELKETKKKLPNENIENNNYEEYKVLKKESSLEEIQKNINIDSEDYEKLANNVIARQNDMLQIEDSDIDVIIEQTKSMEKLRKQIDYFDENDIQYSDEIFSQISNKISDKIIDKLNEEGYTGRYIKDKYVYDQYDLVQSEYRNMQKYFDDNDINYKISNSTNAGELPSIYLETKDGDVFRIANHYNHQSDERQMMFNKKYTAGEYKEWKNIILKDIEEGLGIRMGTLSEIQNYYIKKGYSKATALKMAKEDIKERKETLK